MLNDVMEGLFSSELNQELYTTAFQVAQIIGPVDRRISKVILFGSVARGEATPDSDIDLAITLPDVTKSKNALLVMMACYSALEQRHIRVGETPGGVTIEAISESEYFLGERADLLHGEIKNGGIVLYQRDG